MKRSSEESFNESSSSGKPAAKRKITSDNILRSNKELPKKPHSAYNLFFSEQRPELLQRHALGTSKPDFEENFNTASTAGKKESQALFQAASRTIANRWKDMSPAEKLPYEQRAADAMKEYRKKMKVYEDGMVEEALKQARESSARTDLASQSRVLAAAQASLPARQPQSTTQGAAVTYQYPSTASAAGQSLRALDPLFGWASSAARLPHAPGAPVSYVLPPGFPINQLDLSQLTTRPVGQPSPLFSDPSNIIRRDHFATNQALHHSQLLGRGLAQDQLLQELQFQRPHGLPQLQHIPTPRTQPLPTLPNQGGSAELWQFPIQSPSQPPSQHYTITRISAQGRSANQQELSVEEMRRALELDRLRRLGGRNP